MRHAWVWLVLVGCKAEEAGVLAADPPSGSLSGYYPVTFDLADAGVAASDVVGVSVGGVDAYDLDVQGTAVTVHVQGAPTPGAKEVVIETARGTTGFPSAFRYDPPLDPLFDRVVAMGASLTQGVQGGVPVQHGVLHSPPHLLAKQTGAYLPLPLLVEPLFPSIGWSDVGEAPACTIPDIVQHVASAAIEVLAVLDDPSSDSIAFWQARIDPDLTVHNVAVGDSQLAALVHGPPDDVAELFVVKIVYEPYLGILDPVPTSQLELVEQLDPTLVMITDTYGNDLIKSIALSSSINPSVLTPADEIRADLVALANRLAATGAEVFLANMPRPTLLPATNDKRAQAIAEAFERGGDAEAAEAELQVDADIAEIEAMGLEYNQILDEVAAERSQVYVVDLYAAVADIEANGLPVGNEVLHVDKFAGLLSTDGVHFGDVGYGLLADLFVTTINRELGTAVPAVDLAALLADDPYGFAAQDAAGFDRSACE